MSITWSIEPLLKTTVPKEAIVSIFESIDLYRRAFPIFIIMSITYPVVHRILVSFKNYCRLESDTKQVTVLHHAIEAIVLTIATPFFTYFVIKTNFDLHPEDTKADIISTSLICLCFMAMYLYELSSRFKSPRPMLIVHHLLAVSDGYLLFAFPTTVMMKTCVILVYFICFEALTFVGLFMYRMAPMNKFTPKVMFSGLVVFGVTRPIQVVWVLAAALGSWNDPNHVKWQAIMQIIVTCILTTIQAWSLTINYAVYKRCLKKIKCNGEDEKLAKRVVASRTRGTVLNESMVTAITITDTDHSNGMVSMDPEDSACIDSAFIPPAFLDNDEVDNVDQQHESDSLEDSSVNEGFSAFLAFLKDPSDHDAPQDQDKEEKCASKAQGIPVQVFIGVLAMLMAAMFTVIMIPIEFLD